MIPRQPRAAARASPSAGPGAAPLECLRTFAFGAIHSLFSVWRLPPTPLSSLVPQVTVILKHLFSPEEFIENPLGKEELEADVRSECAKLGKVDKVGSEDASRAAALLLGDAGGEWH